MTNRYAVLTGAVCAAFFLSGCVTEPPKEQSGATAQTPSVQAPARRAPQVMSPEQRKAIPLPELPPSAVPRPETQADSLVPPKAPTVYRPKVMDKKGRDEWYAKQEAMRQARLEAEAKERAKREQWRDKGREDGRNYDAYRAGFQEGQMGIPTRR